VGLLEENFRQPEAATTDLLGILVTYQCKAFLADFGEKNLPCLLLDLLWVELDS